MTNIFIGEILGTAALILLGNGVVSNVVYKKSKGAASGWIVITAGWALAVYIGVQVANSWGTGAHINPAVTIAVLLKNAITIGQAGVYIVAQILGAIIGQLLVNIIYAEHIKEETNGELVLAAHATGPTHPQATITNFMGELIGTFVLVSMVLLSSKYFAQDLGAIGQFVGPLSVAMVVFAIGLSLGGPTGYAINPARDLGPRIYFALTQSKKGLANWNYAWIPILGPISGAILAALIF